MSATIAIEAAAILAGLIGTKKGLDGIEKSKKADKIQKSAENILNDCKVRIEINKKKTSNSIQELGKEKLEAYAKEIKDFVDNFSKLKNVNLTEVNIINELNYCKILSAENINSIKLKSLEATNILSGSLVGVGTGMLLGWGTYGGVMALGSASTGTAIAGLSGAAATNATLAWIGGGSIATGGGGIVLGKVILGGIIMGPALLIAGGIFDLKAKEKLNSAYSNLAKAKEIESEIKKGIVQLNYIRFTANQINSLLKEVRKYCRLINYEMIKIISSKTDWELCSLQEKNIIAASIKQVQLLKKIVDTPLLTEDGLIVKEINELKKIKF